MTEGHAEKNPELTAHAMKLFTELYLHRPHRYPEMAEMFVDADKAEAGVFHDELTNLITEMVQKANEAVEHEGGYGYGHDQYQRYAEAYETMQYEIGRRLWHYCDVSNCFEWARYEIPYYHAEPNEEAGPDEILHYCDEHSPHKALNEMEI